jgi:hypothetical protein
MDDLKITYRCQEQEGELLLWVQVNDDPELGPVRLDGPSSAELNELFDRMTALIQRIQKPTTEPPTVPSRPSHVRSTFGGETD